MQSPGEKTKVLKKITSHLTVFAFLWQKHYLVAPHHHAATVEEHMLFQDVNN